ncbi:zinc-dependent peptidase [soil metagenome]
MLHFLRNRRRDTLRAQPFPPAWRAIMDRDVAYAAHLTPEERRELEGLVQIFLDEKHFEGCGGLELTDEIRVTIAAEACRLLLHRDTDIYPQLVSILVYPGAYKATRRSLEGRVVIEREDARLGESRMRDAVVLTWDHVLQSARHIGGDNVVLHELAHQLDAEDGAMDGAPSLGDRARYASWARVLGEEFAELSERVHAGRPSDIDPYGATNPAEFFAVITEMFFERSAQLKRRHPALYAELAAFYHQDPAARHAPT